MPVWRRDAWSCMLYVAWKKRTSSKIRSFCPVLLKWGKELGKCTLQWTTNDEKNQQVLSTLSVFFRLKKKDNDRRKKEAINQPSLPTPFLILFLCLFLSTWFFWLYFIPYILLTTLFSHSVLPVLSQEFVTLPSGHRFRHTNCKTELRILLDLLRYPF